jgi:hypothetical protein
MINALFMVTSAIESRYGIYTPGQRLDQTLETIQCLRDRVPGCVISLNEVSGNGLADQYAARLEDAVDYYLDFTENSDVRYIYNKPEWVPNWDVVKNLTELTTFPVSLKTLQEAGALEGIDRVFKMSGRYLLNDKFDLSLYKHMDVVDRVVIGRDYPSQFPVQVTGLTHQYMCRLLSWPTALHTDMIGWYEKGRDYMKQRMSVGGYADIEHCLYYALPRDQVYQLDEVGVYGNIAPNGAPIIN